MSLDEGICGSVWSRFFTRFLGLAVLGSIITYKVYLAPWELPADWSKGIFNCVLNQSEIV